MVEMALASQANPGTKTSATVLRIEEIHPTKATSPFSFSAEEVSRTGGLIGNYPAALRGVFNRNVFTSKSCDYPCSILSRSFHVYRTSPGLKSEAF